MNRRIVATRAGGPDVLQLVEEPLPAPQPGEVRVKVLAAGVSAYDLMVRGSRLMPPKHPFTPGVDIVGVVDELSENVDGLEPGQRVGALLGFGNGGYAEHVCVPANDLVLVPDRIDPAQAVCVIANYLTAHRVMHGTANLQEGESILVQGAAGGVGSAILELGRLARLKMVGTASPRNHELVASLGATPIDYKSENVVQRTRELTDGGVDATFDHIGGFRQLLRSYRSLKRGGRLVWFGVAATKTVGIRIIPYTLLTMLLLKSIPDSRKALFASESDDYAQRVLPQLIEHLAQGDLHPVIAARFPLAEAARAHELLERGRYAGKVVLLAGN